MRRVRQFLGVDVVNRILTSADIRALHPDFTSAALSRGAARTPVAYKGCLGCGGRSQPAADTSHATVARVLRDNPEVRKAVERLLGIDELII